MVGRRTVGVLLALAVGAGTLGATPVFGAGEPPAQRATEAGPPTAYVAFRDPGSGGTLVKIDRDGGVAWFESPLGFEHLSAGARYDGYVLCYERAGRQVAAWDLIDTAQGFGPSSNPKLTQVVRRTTDGALTLEVDFTWVGPERQLTVTHHVTNNSGEALAGVVLRRHSDVDVSSGGRFGWSSFRNTFVRSGLHGVFAASDPRDASAEGASHSMLLRHLAGPRPEARVVGVADASCAPHSVNVPAIGDFAASLSYRVDRLEPGRRVLISKVAYERQ